MDDVESEWDKLQGALIDWQRTLEHHLQRLLELYKAEDHLDVQLQQAEMVKESWEPTAELPVHSLQEHIDTIKVRVCLNAYSCMQRFALKWCKTKNVNTTLHNQFLKMFLLATEAIPHCPVLG